MLDPETAGGAPDGDRRAHARAGREGRRHLALPRRRGAGAGSPTRSTTRPTASTTCSSSTPQPATLDEVTRVLKITDGVMRHMATRRAKGGGRVAPPPLPRPRRPQPRARGAAPEPVAAAAAPRTTEAAAAEAGNRRFARAALEEYAEPTSRSRRRRRRRRRRRPSMANINRVVLVGNLTKDPELQAHLGRHVALQAADRRQHAAQGRDRPVGRQAELLRRHRLGQPGRELRAVPLEGPPGRRSTAASSGASGTRPTGPASARPSRSSPRASSSWAAATAAAAAATRRSSCPRAPPARAPTSRRPPPTTTSRSRRRQQWHSRSNAKERSTSRRRPPAERGQPRRRNCRFCRDKVEEVDYKNIPTTPPFISEKGKIRSRRITGACRRHQVQVGSRGEAGARDGPPPLRLGELDCEVILLAGRREGRPARRGRRRRARVRPQLPAPAEARRAGDAGARGRAPEARRRSARGRRRRRSSRRASSRRRSRRRSSAST